MASNMLLLPFRRTHAVSLRDAIKAYISDKYDQHPQMFASDLDAIDKLRTDAVNAVEPHSSGIFKIQAYAAQLVWMGAKFPVDIGVEFAWYPALGYNTTRPVIQDNIRFELINILFNMAAMYSQLAMASNRSSGEGLKAAYNYFSLAAGIVSHIKTVRLPDLRTEPPEDMDVASLESVEGLMLAQAQECFWQKAVKDGLKDASIAKLAAKVSDFYSQAADWGVKSEAISSEWIHHMNAKHHHFAAAAQYRASCDSLEKRKYGEEVARLRDSLNCINEALKESRYVNKAVHADLNGLKARVQEDLKRAEKDNDMIYLIPVPPKAELKALDRAAMVTAKTPPEVADPLSQLGEHGALGRPLFIKLVPYAVHVAASVYTSRRDNLINERIIQKLEALNVQIHETLQSLNLPGSLQALEKPLGLPPTLASHAQDIRQQHGIQRLHRVVADTEKLKNNDRSTYQEGVDLLRSEAAEDESSRRKFGTDRWSRAPSNTAAPQLYQKVTEISGYLDQAANSDTKLQGQIRQHENLIRLLGGTDRDLEDYVPSSRRATMTPKVERAVNSLRTILNDLSRLEARRQHKMDAVRAKAKADDVHHSLLEEATRLEREQPMQTLEASLFDEFFDRRLSMYKSEQADVAADAREQTERLEKLKEANTVLKTARSGDVSTRDREQALQRLEGAYLAYKEIMSNLDGGRAFYSDLAAVVGRFRDECRAYVHQRGEEARKLEGDLSGALAALSLGGGGQVQQQQQQKQSLPPQGQAQGQHGRHAAVPLAAPMPTRAGGGQKAGQQPGPTAGMWTPDMPIKFGGQ